MEKVELDFGAWGTVYYDARRPRARLDAVRAVAGVPARVRAAGRPAVRRLDARHVRVPRRRVESRGCCSRSSSPRSARRATAALRRSRRSRIATPRASRAYERFRVHKTVFPQDFLADFGFQVVRSSGRVGLSRLELGGLQPVEEGRREKVLEASGARSASRSRSRPRAPSGRPCPELRRLTTGHGPKGRGLAPRSSRGHRRLPSLWKICCTFVTLVWRPVMARRAMTHGSAAGSEPRERVEQRLVRVEARAAGMRAGRRSRG